MLIEFRLSFNGVVDQVLIENRSRILAEGVNCNQHSIVDVFSTHNPTSHQFGSETFIPSSLVTKTFKLPSSSLAMVKNNPAS